jgi:GNAT superfamily N-acetyltransferase
MQLAWRHATADDTPLLASWNHQLIRDEGHRNSMNVAQLEERMRSWLQEGYRAVIFTATDPVAYALYRVDPDQVYLRHLFVHREHRRRGIGRTALEILRREIWPTDRRLTVDVLCANTPTLAFWRAVGYRDYCLTLEIMPRKNIPDAPAA